MLQLNVSLFMMLLLMSFGFNKEDRIQSKLTKDVLAIEMPQNITYNKIKAGSYLAWHAAHLGGINPRQGKIHYKEASISIDHGKIRNANIVIDMNTLTVEDLAEDAIEDLTEHLKSDDFFDTKNNSTSMFKLTSVEKTQGDFNSKITGDLTLLNVTNSVTFNANVRITKEQVSVKSEYFVIDRSDWGMTYNAKGTLGVPLDYLISNDVGFSVDITLIK